MKVVAILVTAAIIISVSVAKPAKTPALVAKEKPCAVELKTTYRFEVITPGKSFNEIRKLCQAKNGDLIQKSLFKDVIGDDYVKKLGTKMAEETQYWVGITDGAAESTWKTLADGKDGKAFLVDSTKIVKWHGTEPDNQNNSDCATMSKKGHDFGRLKDYQCTASFEGLCEIPE